MERSIFQLHFGQVNERSMHLFYARIVTFVELSRVYFSYEGIISIAVKNSSSGVALRFDFVYYWCQPFFLFAPRTLVRFLFFFDSPPSLPLHTAKPFGRYNAPSLQILYHFYEA